MPYKPQSALRDNRTRGTVGDFLANKIVPGSKLSIVSAYFTIYAFEQLKEKLQGIDHLDFLFGEPRFVKSLDPYKTDTKSFKIEDEKLSLSNRLQQKAVAKECAAWIRNKINIKSIKQANLLHGKMYHVDNQGIEKALIGSSNFTVSGLGYGNTPNIELNLEVADDRDRADLKSWFYEIWNDEQLVEDVKTDVLSYLEQLYQENTPEFIYYKTLYHIFERFLSEQETGGFIDEKTHLYDTKIWKMLFDFQKDGVRGAINKMLRHNGCIIADSVGLGKTFEALAIIKYFELLNDRVLVLYPKKLRDNWTVYQANNNSELNILLEDRFNYTVLSHTDLSRDSGRSGDIDLEKINWGNYNLVVIDESHNFRNNTKGKKDEEGNTIRTSRYERLMNDIISKGVRTKVLMLSATPVNNNLRDLRNQIYFITEEKDDAFKDSFNLPSIGEILKVSQNKFTHWSKKPRREIKGILESFDSGFFKLLDELTIARSRRHIQRYYNLKQIGEFPKREKPKSIYPFIDLKNEFISYDQLNKEIQGYKLTLFNPFEYVLSEYKSAYDTEKIENFTQGKRENYLIGMMKVNFLKRLESSVNSFAVSMDRTINKISELESKINEYKKNKSKIVEIDLDDLQVTDNDEETSDAWEVGKKVKYALNHMDVDRWLNDLVKDREQLKRLFEEASAVTMDRDAKLAELRELIKEKVLNPTTDRDGRKNRKALVFTAFADTADYLFGALKDWAIKDLKVNIAMVSGGSKENKTTFGKNEFTNILTNFSPVSKNRDKIKSMKQDEEIDILIATDCISEGQNLQDCDCLINYDIHWNPVRIIQRFGRIDRIGSRNKKVFMFNFWPTKDLDNYITLKERVEARMALVDIAATTDDNLLSQDIKDLIQEDLKYRDRQLKKLKEEVLDMEDVSDGIALSEFTLDDFRIELINYIESNMELLEKAPLGLYAVVPPPLDSQVIDSGVIFCLRQIGDTSGNEAVNPLQPFYLVYIRDNGDVRYNFTNAKQILEIFRMIAAGNDKAYEDLCNIFNNETSNGNEMNKYDVLLGKAVDEITKTFKKRAVSALLSGRGGRLPTQAQQVKGSDDFELITWLIIKSEQC
ncbi:MAG: helicase-related protein [Dissulfurispiraceae bacterium]|jgi:SNF2 family DNA or RNA helicase|nr:helicase-related protein [Dissulfurispiraceae bacterium]